MINFTRGTARDSLVWVPDSVMVQCFIETCHWMGSMAIIFEGLFVFLTLNIANEMNGHK